MALAHDTTAATLGPFDVSTDPVAVAAFVRAAGLTGTSVPFTFPITWFAHPTIRAAILARVEPGEVAFHEDQSFDYTAALELDAAYRFVANIARQDDPGRVVLEAEVERDGARVLVMRTQLRLLIAPVEAVQGATARQQAAAAQQSAIRP